MIFGHVVKKVATPVVWVGFFIQHIGFGGPPNKSNELVHLASGQIHQDRNSTIVVYNGKNPNEKKTVIVERGESQPWATFVSFPIKQHSTCPASS